MGGDEGRVTNPALMLIITTFHWFARFFPSIEPSGKEPDVDIFLAQFLLRSLWQRHALPTDRDFIFTTIIRSKIVKLT